MSSISRISQPQFAVFDIDGTLFRWQLFSELVFELIKQGLLPPETAQKITDAHGAWRDRQHPAAYHDYETEVVQAIERHLKGMPVAAFKQAARQALQRSGNQVHRYTRDLLAALKQQGYLLFAISGSFAEIVEPFAKQHGFDDWAASVCQHKNGRYTGQYDWTHKRKAEVLRAMVRKHNATYRHSVGIGDSESDVPMLELVGQPIAFNPTRGLLDEAMRRGWKVVVERKDIAYELTRHRAGYILQV